RTIIKYFSVFLLILIVAVIFYQVIARYVFGVSSPWSSELPVWAMVWIVFIGSVLGVAERSHPRVDFLINLLPKKGKAIMEIFNDLVCALLNIFLSYQSISLISSHSKNISLGLGVPVSILYYSLLIGGCLMAFFFFINIYETIRKNFGKGVAI